MRTLRFAAACSLAASTLLAAAVPGSADAKSKARAEDAPRAPAEGPEARIRALEARLEHLERELARRPLDISSYHLPEKVELCGQPVRLDDPDVRERLEREFYLMLGDRDQVVIWAKRARRVFPAIDAAVARTAGACPDVRYLAVIESGLRPTVTSHANAHGYWQFMAPTAREYGLSVDGGWDERAELEASSKAGVQYLADLARGFGGDWSLAMAAYNTGMGRLRNAMETQSRRDFWRLDLVDEAERYVPRVLAAKLIMTRLAEYGFDLDEGDGYAPEPVERLTMRLPAGRGVSLLEAARVIGVDYRTLRRLNPGLTDASLPAGRTFSLAVPPGRAEAARLLAGRGPSGEPEDAPAGKRPPAARAVTAAATREGAHHVVRRGDSLGAIAARHRVSVDELRRWNRLSRKDPIREGQKLIVRR